MSDANLYQGLVSVAGQVNSFLVFGGIVALLALAAKFLIKNDEGTVPMGGVDISLNHIWIVMLLLTLAHVYYSWALLVEITRLLECNDKNISKSAWQQLTQDADNLRVLQGLSAREPANLFGAIFSRPSASTKDTLMLVHLALAVCVFFATVRWFRTRSWTLRTSTTVVAVALIAINWTAGSYWALLASDLKRHGDNEPVSMADLRKDIVRTSGASCLKVE